MRLMEAEREFRRQLQQATRNYANIWGGHWRENQGRTIGDTFWLALYVRSLAGIFLFSAGDHSPTGSGFQQFRQDIPDRRHSAQAFAQKAKRINVSPRWLADKTSPRSLWIIGPVFRVGRAREYSYWPITYKRRWKQRARRTQESICSW